MCGTDEMFFVFKFEEAVLIIEISVIYSLKKTICLIFEEIIKQEVKVFLKLIARSLKEKIILGLKSPKRFFSPRLISLEEACKKAYEALGNTFMRDFIDRLNRQDIFGYFIQDFLIFGINFHGMHPPSTIHEIIPNYNLKRGSFKNDESYRLYPPYAPLPSHTGLMIEARQLVKYIKKRKNDYKQLNASFS